MDNLRNRKIPKIGIKDKSSDVFEKNSINELKKKNATENKSEVYKENNGENIKKDYEKDTFVPSCSSSEQKIIGRINFQLDVISISLLVCGLVTRMYKLEKPRNIV